MLDEERPSPANYESPGQQRYHSFLEQSLSEHASDPRAIVKSISFHAPAPSSRSRRDSDTATSTLRADGVAPVPADRTDANHSNGARTAQKRLPHRSDSYKIGHVCVTDDTSVAASRGLGKSPSIGGGSPLQPTARSSNAGLASPLTSHPTTRSRNSSARSQGAASVSSSGNAAATSPPTQSRYPVQTHTQAAAARNGKGATSPPTTATLHTRRRLHTVPTPSSIRQASGSPSSSSVALSPSGPATPPGGAFPPLNLAATSPAASPGAPGRPSPAAGRPPVPPRVQLTTVSAPTLRVQWDNLEGPDTGADADGSTEVWGSQRQLVVRAGAGGATVPGMQQGGARVTGGSSWAGVSGGKGVSEGGSVLAGGAASPPVAASTSSGGTLADLDAVTPRVGVRPPRWLKLSAFQVVEKLRTGKLQVGHGRGSLPSA